MRDPCSHSHLPRTPHTAHRTCAICTQNTRQRRDVLANKITLQLVSKRPLVNLRCPKALAGASAGRLVGWSAARLLGSVPSSEHHGTSRNTAEHHGTSRNIAFAALVMDCYWAVNKTDGAYTVLASPPISASYECGPPVYLYTLK